MAPAARLDELTGVWLRGLADTGRLENLLRAIAIDGKWLRGIGDGQQVKLLAAMLHEEKVIIAQLAIPEDTNEITQVRELLDPVNLAGAGRNRPARRLEGESSSDMDLPAGLWPGQPMTCMRECDLGVTAPLQVFRGARERWSRN